MNGIVYFNWFNMLNIFSGPRSHLSFGIDEFPAMSKRHTQDGHEDEDTNRVVGETWCLSHLQRRGVKVPMLSARGDAMRQRGAHLTRTALNRCTRKGTN